MQRKILSTLFSKCDFLLYLNLAMGYNFMNTKFITASIFTLISVSIAQAADVMIPEKPVHVASPAIVFPPFSWTGFYFGGQIGGFSSKTSAITRDVDIPLFPDEESRLKKWTAVEKYLLPELSGFIGGLYAGFNFDLGRNFILGFDTDILFPGQKKKTKTFFRVDKDEEEGEEKDSITFNHTLKQKWTGATRVRIGFSTNRVMPYLSGGVAYGQLQDIMMTSITGEEPFNATLDETRTIMGYTLGGGFDFAITDHVIMRAEYRYSDFGKKTYQYKGKDEIEIKHKTNDFRIGLAYKF